MLSKLKRSYDQVVGDADRFRSALMAQVSDLLEQNSLRPPIPIESRIKKWPSILLKLDRLAESWDDAGQIWDLIGLRFIFLFTEEAAQACSLIDKNFKVIDRRNVGKKLLPNEFGYQSIHFTVRLLPEWLNVPSLRNYSAFQAEMQVRTLAQHNWAVASRLLQYNDQSNAPPSVQRSLYRVAALLEIVDLELERVHKERDAYKEQIAADSFEQSLNVDLLEAILDSYLPESHRIPTDDYATLLVDLNSCRIKNGTGVIALIDKRIKQALENDAMAVKAAQMGDATYEDDPARLKEGVFYSHVGLMQNILNLEFGVDWRNTYAL
jgi:ppGpp synthetase/RelA/SpoT-type nucleotidyltranferase